MAILVVGATNNIGTKVVNSLLAQDREVIALVTESDRDRQITWDKVRVFNVDLTAPETLTKEILEGISTVIYCSEIKDNLEQIEYPKIFNLIKAISQYLPPDSDRVLFDFTDSNLNIQENWGTVNDGVMGGVSQSKISLINNKAVFSGIVSIDNNGGFASVRTRNFQPPLDLSDFQGIELKVKGDGKRYKFITRCEGQWDGIGYCYSFDTIHDFFTTVRIPFANLIPVFRAKTVTNADKLDSSRVYSMQLMLSKFEYDGTLNPKFEPGHFGLEIEYIKAYGDGVKPQFILISSASATDIYHLNARLQKPVLESSNLTYTVINASTIQPESNELLILNLGIQNEFLTLLRP